MTASNSSTGADTRASSPMPLFYRNPQPLSSQNHASWRLKPGNAAFAGETSYAPIVTAEFAHAARNYPIVFSTPQPLPLAVLGLERTNLFVTGDKWNEDTYVPAYVRRYPFVFMDTSDPENFLLAIDAGSDRVVQSGTEGEPLFEAGKPSAVTQQAVKFCETFQGEMRVTRAFCEALVTHQLLIPQRADATLNNGRKLSLDGFQIIDGEKLTKLADAVVVDWHRRGWLSLAYFHLASLDHFPTLVARQSARAA